MTDMINKFGSKVKLTGWTERGLGGEVMYEVERVLDQEDVNSPLADGSEKAGDVVKTVVSARDLRAPRTKEFEVFRPFAAGVEEWHAEDLMKEIGEQYEHLFVVDWAGLVMPGEVVTLLYLQGGVSYGANIRFVAQRPL